MDSDSEEVEIKIEYNESFETDPLCDNFEVIEAGKLVDNGTTLNLHEVSLINIFTYANVL